MSVPIYIDAQFVRHQIDRLKLVYPELSEDAELWADTLEGQTDFNEILTRLVREERDAASFVQAMAAQEYALSGRRERFARKQVALRSMMLSVIEASSQKTVRLPEATISLSQSSPRPVVDDETALPDALCRIRRSPNLTAIKEAFEAGQTVTGAHMSNGSTSLSIRVK